jgi:hypothetical protein
VDEDQLRPEHWCGRRSSAGCRVAAREGTAYAPWRMFVDLTGGLSTRSEVYDRLSSSARKRHS